MSYPELLNTRESLDDLLSRKEFAQLHLDLPSQEGVWNPSFIDELIKDEKKLFLHPQQRFIRNILSPETKIKRMLAKHATGVGKTVAALMLAFEYINYYKRQYAEQTPLVFVIGFSKPIFQKELLQRPEFGFVSREEVKEHTRLRHQAESGALVDQENLQEFESRLRKRLSRKNLGGYFKFFGYKEFFNRVFRFEKREEEAGDEGTVLKALAEGRAFLDFDLISAFSNSLVICDEIHNVYNSVKINNYGIALRVLFNMFDLPGFAWMSEKERKQMLQNLGTGEKEKLAGIENSMLRVLLLTATPINNSPTEIVDLLNLLVPQSTLPGGRALRKEEFFLDERNLKPGALEKMGDLVRGYVSFMQSKDPRFFPRRVMEGVEIPIPRKLDKERIRGFTFPNLPYLRFERCEMSEFHYRTYKSVYQGTLPPDGSSLMDMVLPNPGLLNSSKEGVGLFRSKDIRFNLKNAPQSWKDKQGIDFVKYEDSNYSIITGRFLERKTLEEYSSKYARMVDLLLENLRTGGGKVLIVHQFVKMSGVLFLQEVLRYNGFVDETTSPSNETLCVYCAIPRAKHPAAGGHDYSPARFILVHGEMDSLSFERSISRFNRPENLHGNLFRVLLSSKKINEGVDLMAVRNTWIMSVPANIATLLQILGRSIRNFSHILLSVAMREARIRIFVSSLPRKYQREDLSYEEHKYFENLMDYLVIQKIERVFHSNAVDAPLYRETLLPLPQALDEKRGNRALLRKKSYKHPDLGVLYFDLSPVFSRNWREIAEGEKLIDPRTLDTRTFYPFYSREETDFVLWMLKRLFTEQSTVWTLEELWQAVKNPPFETHLNTRLISRESFLVALNRLSPKEESSTLLDRGEEEEGAGYLLSRLFNPLDVRVLHKGRECRVVKKHRYYMLLPVFVPQSLELTDSYIQETLGYNETLLRGKTIVDVDSWYRREVPARKTSVRITEYLKTTNVFYSQMKYRFYNQFKDTPVEEMPTSMELYDLEFHTNLVEDAIRYAFEIYTNPEFPFSELHEFYFKMLYYYDRLEMILFADQVEGSKLEEHYRMFLLPPDPRYGLHNFSELSSEEVRKVKEERRFNAFLMTSILRSEEEEKQRFQIHRLNDFLVKRGRHGKLPISEKGHLRLEDMDLERVFQGSKKTKTPSKVSSNLLPVGHFLSSLETSSGVATPRLYLPDGTWMRSNELALEATASLAQETENDLIIGYYEKAPASIEVRFKLRMPIHLIQKHEDQRMVERGASCHTKRKEELVQVLKNLGILKKLSGGVEQLSIKEICSGIKLELMKREMESRKKWKHGTEKRIRWFYLHFEPQPGDTGALV